MTTASHPLVGELVDGRYRVLRHLADGGMATVLLATDTRLDREVALKVMRPDLAADQTFVSRFRREARSAARLSHPNVVPVHDQGEDDGRVFLAMEYVEGRSVRELVDAEGALTPRAALDIMASVLTGLTAAHDAGYIHRDVKPENILIADNGQVKVADFGLARAVTSQTTTADDGVLYGTVVYLSPEQVERGIADARSDVCSRAPGPSRASRRSTSPSSTSTAGSRRHRSRPRACRHRWTPSSPWRHTVIPTSGRATRASTWRPSGPPGGS